MPWAMRAAGRQRRQGEQVPWRGCRGLQAPPLAPWTLFAKTPWSEKLGAFWRDAKPWDVSWNCPTRCWAGTMAKGWSSNHSKEVLVVMSARSQGSVHRDHPTDSDRLGASPTGPAVQHAAGAEVLSEVGEVLGLWFIR
jgi:hypothetical protein